MYGDFSRLTFSPAKHYTAVWSQQGRVLLDSDANEQTSILLEWLRTFAIDFMGPFGGHVTRAGFRVEVHGNDLTLSPGHYYVHGLRCEVPHRREPGTATDYLVPVEDAAEPPYLVELLVWERSVSAVADPELLEPGLGPHPPDTTVRTQVAWVPIVSKALPLPSGEGTLLADVEPDQLNADYLTAEFEKYNTAAHPLPRLAARAEHAVETAEHTIVPSTSGYLGVENQLYRVEVHAGGAARTDTTAAEGQGRGATFKWSRDNGSAEFGIVSPAADKTSVVTVASLGRDGRTGLQVGDWVEVIDDDWAPFGKAPPLRTVKAISGSVVTLDPEVRVDPALHPYLRRWDQPETTGEHGIPIVESSDDNATWTDLEDGVQVRFASDRAHYRRGDYWLIPARTATGGVLWPGDAEPTAIPPVGPERFLAPLAIVKKPGEVTDVRILFTHLAWPDSDAPNGTGASET